MFKLLCILLSIMLPGGLFAQETTERVRDQSILIDRIESVERQNSRLSIQIRSRDSISYCMIRQEIFEAFNNTPQLEFDFKNTTEKIALSSLFTKLMQANNPSSDILGFRFNDIVFSACEKHFLVGIKDEKEKRRFGSIVRKIIGNPIVTSLANTNPISSVVAAIISAIAGFTSPEIELRKEGNRIREIGIDNKDVVEQKNIQDFRNELQVYIDFYDAIIRNADRYLLGLDQLNMKYGSLMQSVKGYKLELFSSLEGGEGNMLMQLATFLPDPMKDQIDFDHYLTDTRVLAAYATSRRFPLLQESVNEFKKEYCQLLVRFLEEYRKILLLSGQFPAGTVDPVKITALVNDITSFIRDQVGENLNEFNTDTSIQSP